MRDLIDRALLNISRMSKEDFDKRLQVAKNSQIALALRDMEELSNWCSSSIYGTFNLEQFVVSAGLVEFRYLDVEDYLLLLAANDERFALAA